MTTGVMTTRLIVLAAATASFILAGDGDWTEKQVTTNLAAIQTNMAEWVKAHETKKADCEALVKKIIGSSGVAGPADTKFHGKTVYHDTDARNSCTLFFTGNGKEGQIVGIGFHTGNSSEIYNLYYKNPAWPVPTSEMSLAKDYAAAEKKKK